MKRIVAASFMFGVFVAACIGTTIDAKNYNQTCDADSECVVIQTGDICSCACSLGAINDVDYDKYTDDVERIGACLHSCVSDDPDAAPYTCGSGVGAHCQIASGVGSCATYALPADAGAE